MADLSFTQGADPVEMTESASGNIVKVSADGSARVEKTDLSKASYSASVTGLAAALTPTDIFTITGSASKTIRITSVEISGTENTAAIRDVLLVKRSTANTGGTSSSPTAVPYDSSDAAASATVLSYTANPTLGTLVGTVRSVKYDLAATNLVGNVDRITWIFGDRPCKAIVLRGTSQVLAVNLNGVTSASNSWNITIEWTEE